MENCGDVSVSVNRSFIDVTNICLLSFNSVDAGLLFDPVQVILGPGEAGWVSHLQSQVTVKVIWVSLFTFSPLLILSSSC